MGWASRPDSGRPDPCGFETFGSGRGTTTHLGSIDTPDAFRDSSSMCSATSTCKVQGSGHQRRSWVVLVKGPHRGSPQTCKRGGSQAAQQHARRRLRLFCAEQICVPSTPCSAPSGQRQLLPGGHGAIWAGAMTECSRNGARAGRPHTEVPQLFSHPAAAMCWSRGVSCRRPDFSSVARCPKHLHASAWQNRSDTSRLLCDCSIRRLALQCRLTSMTPPLMHNTRSVVPGNIWLPRETAILALLIASVSGGT